VARIVQCNALAGDRVGRRLAEEVTEMKNALLAACGAVALASTMTLPQPPSPTQPITRTDHNPITVTGCLKAWDNTMGAWPADPVAKPGAPMARPGEPMVRPGQTPMASTRYVLTNVTTDKPAAQSSTPAPSADAAPPGHPQASQFIVMAGSGVNLAPHLNHQVRLTGTVDVGVGHGATARADRPADTPTARPGDPPTVPGMAADHKAGDHTWATLTATSVTMISATCTSTVR
jgi:hypothetical protein